MSEKLQKVLARAGFGSRRQIEEWISAGRVSVNRKTATIGDRVTSDDHIELDGRLVKSQVLFGQNFQRVLLYHKDIGSVCSRSDPDHHKTVFKDFPPLHKGRWVTVGRLDINTSGLLLVTNDGDLANRLMHPSYKMEREYLVRVLGNVNQTDISALKQGIQLEDGLAKFLDIEEMRSEGSNKWFRVVLGEGRKRVVRRAWEALGYQVSRLTRIRFGPVKLPRGLRRGTWRDMPQPMLKQLYQQAGLTLETNESQTWKPKMGKNKTADSRHKEPHKERHKRRFRN